MTFGIVAGCFYAGLASAQESNEQDDLDFLLQESAPSETQAGGPGGGAETESSEKERSTTASESAVNDNSVAADSSEVRTEVKTKQARSSAIEEIIVTAQKREQSIQDVPISMSVLSDEFLVEQGVNDLATALLFVPNVKITAAGFFAAPNARGFTFNNNNKAFEPPLGLAIDGIPYTRIPYFLAATFDLQRIEVLRGPQGTTFGKNTTAGLIHMISKNPTDEFTGFVSVQEGELNRSRTELAFGGPLIEDAVNFRIAGFFDQREGYVENTASQLDPQANENFLGHDRDGVRLKLDFVDLGGSELQLKYEKVRLDDLGTGLEIIRSSPQIRAFVRQFDPNADFERGNLTASMNAPDFRQVEIETIGAEWNYDLSDWGLVAQVNHSVLDNFLRADQDFTSAPSGVAIGGDTSPTETYEFRVVSPELNGFFGLDNLLGWDLGSSDFLVGAFYQERAINDSILRLIFDVPVLAGLLAADQVSGDTLPDPLADALAGVLELTRPLLAPTLGALQGTIFEDVTQNFEQQAESRALFGEFQWHFLPEWTLQTGMRLGAEEKQGRWNQTFNQPQPAILLPLIGIEEFQAAKAVDEEQFQHKVALNWQPWDNVSLFLHRAEAVKSGGFNAFAISGRDDELVYDPEFTTEWSLIARTHWLNGTLKANIGVYRMDVEDFQVLIGVTNRAVLSGSGQNTVVTNAAEARAQGVEGDLQWLATDWLTLIGTIGYNDTEFLNFTQNDCPNDMPQADGCDATGKSFPFTPEWNNTLTALVRLPLFNSGLEFTASTTVEQVTEQFLDTDLDPRTIQDSFERYKASVGISDPRRGWSFQIIGENLTDERIGIRQGGTAQNLLVELQEAPRLFYGQFSWRF